MENIPNITITVIFDGSALNRNEKIGGNILSVKKLTVNGQEKTFISKVAIRHYLFATLQKVYKWHPAKVITDDVIQFDVLEDDILTSEELDVFGYMNTSVNVTRKSPLGITKAISIFPFEQDMAIYANHNLVDRGRKQGLDLNPDPYNKEEHSAFYKLSFTFDMLKLGKDEWIIDKYEIEGNKLKLSKIVKKKKTTQTLIKEIVYSERKEENSFETKNGTIEIEKIGTEKNKHKLTFIINKDTKKKRLKDILSVIRNGIVAHSSGEDNTLTPVFMIAAAVKAPSPVFHSFIDVKRKNDGLFEVIGINDGLKNGWIEDKKVYIFDCERVKKQNIDNEKNITKDWNEFLTQLNLNNNENDSDNT